jgi:hypothetical protein
MENISWFSHRKSYCVKPYQEVNGSSTTVAPGDPIAASAMAADLASSGEITYRYGKYFAGA